MDKRRGRWRGEVMISDDKNQHSGNIICDDDKELVLGENK